MTSRVETGEVPNSGNSWVPLSLIVILYLGLVALYEGLAASSATTLPTLCHFRRWTGIPCPTCGTTRMVRAVLEGDLVSAARHNPLMFGLVTALLVAALLRMLFGFQVSWPTRPRTRRLAAACAVGVFLANWAYILAR